VAGSRGERQPSESLLGGILKCGICGASMQASFCVKHRGDARVRYAFYRCSTRVKRGAAACASRDVSAPVIERQVVEKIAEVVRADPSLVALIAEQAREQLAAQKKSLAGERRALTRALRQDDARHTAPHHARLAEIKRESASLAGTVVEEGDVGRAVAEFHALWAALLPRERRRVVEVIVERVVVAGGGIGPTIAFNSGGFGTPVDG